MDYAALLSGAAEYGVTLVLLLLFVWYFLKRDKERETGLVEEKVKLRDEFRKQKEDIDRELESHKKSARDKEALLLSENAKREELIRRESEKREQIIREEAIRREEALMNQLDKMNGIMKEISASMDGINQSMDRMNRNLDRLSRRMDEIEGKVK